jgi:hypothetical protein
MNSLPFNRFGVIQFSFVILWFAVRFPGVAHTDTATQLDLIQNNQVTNQWTLNWFLLLKYTTFGGQSLVLITTIQLLVALFTFRRLVHAIRIEFPRSQQSVTYLIVSPIFGYLATTVNHDLLAACGVILIFILLYEINIRGLQINKSTLLASTFLSTFSYISIFAFLCSVIFIILTSRTKYVWIVALFFGALCIWNFTFPGLSPNEMRGISLVSDIKCAVEDPSAQLSPIQLRSLSSMATMQFWQSNQGYPCASSNQVFSNLDMSGVSDSELISLWLSLGKNNPGSYLKAHLIKGNAAIPPPFSTKPSEVFDLNSTDINTRQNVEFLTMDRSVSYQNLKLFNSFRDFSDLLAFSINLMTGWLSWAGLWLVLIFLIIARQLRVRQIYITFPKLLIVLVPLFSSHIFVFLAAPLSEGRYLLPTILIGLCLFFTYSFELIERCFSSRS